MASRPLVAGLRRGRANDTARAVPVVRVRRGRANDTARAGLTSGIRAVEMTLVGNHENAETVINIDHTCQLRQ